MASRLDALQAALPAALGARLGKQLLDRGELTIEVAAADFIEAATRLRDDPALAFSELLDVIGVDYQGFEGREGPRYAAVYNLLSIAHNWRVRVCVFCPDEDFPALDSVIPVWPSANWYEREAFDLYGIVFRGHPDLRRILTDYGFIGHPFRKDFPARGVPAGLDRAARDRAARHARRRVRRVREEVMRNYTMNFSSGPLEGDALTLNFRKRKLACTQIHGRGGF